MVEIFDDSNLTERARVTLRIRLCITYASCGLGWDYARYPLCIRCA